MNELHRKQQTILHLIESALENFKKIGKNNYTPAKIRSRIATMKETWAQCVIGHAVKDQAVPEELRASYEYFKLKHFDLAYDVYQTTLDYMNECLEEIEPCVSANYPCNRSTNHSANHTHQFSDASSFSVSHLPPINIPPFSGQFEKWESFRDRFTSLIINNYELSAFAKMHFLASSVTGHALDVIKNIAITADNFNIAWQMLMSRYDNKRHLVEVHIYLRAISCTKIFARIRSWTD